MPKPIPRAGVMDIRPYTPGKSSPTSSASGRVFKLSSNESALGPSPNARAAYLAAGDAMALYPDCAATSLRQVIGDVHGLAADQLIIGAGSDEIIHMVLSAYCAAGDEVLQTRHAFSYYAVATTAAGARAVLADERALTADPAALLSAVTDRTRVVFLANPNNPTGTMLRRDALIAFRQALREDVLLVLDGAYAEYVEDPHYTDGADLVDASIAAGSDNVIMMRTFSKIHGLGGLRVGWAYGPASVIETLNRVRSPFNVNSAAAAAAAAAMADQEFVAANRLHNTAERARVAAALTAAGYEVTPSHGNFILFAAPGTSPAEQAANASRILAKLEEAGVMVRSAASSHLPGYVRVSIGATDANDAFIGEISQWSADRIVAGQ